MQCLLLLARFPRPGKVKTRLIPALGAQGAARLHRRMAEVAAATAAGSGAEVTVCTTGAAPERFREWLGAGFRYAAQPKGDLGVRLSAAFGNAFERGAARAVAIGADAPALTSALLHETLSALEREDVVLVPALDGGYVLIGMRRYYPGLLRGIDWGTERVLAQTRGAARRLGLSLREWPPLPDIDRAADLAHLSGDPRFSGKPAAAGRLDPCRAAAIRPFRGRAPAGTSNN